MVIFMNGLLKVYCNGRNVELVIATQKSRGCVSLLSAMICWKINLAPVELNYRCCYDTEDPNLTSQLSPNGYLSWITTKFTNLTLMLIKNYEIMTI